MEVRYIVRRRGLPTILGYFSRWPMKGLLKARKKRRRFKSR
jgi:hypothetical protein